MLVLSPGPLLGSLNLTQSVLRSRSQSARRRRYIEEAELFNIEVNEVFPDDLVQVDLFCIWSHENLCSSSRFCWLWIILFFCSMAGTTFRNIC